MALVQPSHHPLPNNLPRVRRSRATAQRSHAQGLNTLPKGVLLETLTKLTASVILLTATTVALTRALPYYKAQQDRLQEAQTELKLAEARVDRLQEDFQRYFDPQQARTLMQEQSYRIDPSQRRVVWLPGDPEGRVSQDNIPKSAANTGSTTPARSNPSP